MNTWARKFIRVNLSHKFKKTKTIENSVTTMPYLLWVKIKNLTSSLVKFANCFLQMKLSVADTKKKAAIGEDEYIKCLIPFKSKEYNSYTFLLILITELTPFGIKCNWSRRGYTSTDNSVCERPVLITFRTNTGPPPYLNSVKVNIKSLFLLIHWSSHGLQSNLIQLNHIILSTEHTCNYILWQTNLADFTCLYPPRKKTYLFPLLEHILYT